MLHWPANSLDHIIMKNLWADLKWKLSNLEQQQVLEGDTEKPRRRYTAENPASDQEQESDQPMGNSLFVQNEYKGYSLIVEREDFKIIHLNDNILRKIFYRDCKTDH